MCVFSPGISFVAQNLNLTVVASLTSLNDSVTKLGTEIGLILGKNEYAHLSQNGL